MSETPLQTAFPLAWPAGWARQAPYKRKASNYKVTLNQARLEVQRSLRRMGVRDRDIVLSTNIPLRKDGQPYANWREPDDPGVALYWTERPRQHVAGRWQGQSRVIACDHWKTVRENLRAIGLTLEALRSIHRAGASDLLERAFLGFNALPADAGQGALTRPWHLVLGTTPGASRRDIEQAFRAQLQTKHPDKGGTDEQFLELTAAREAGLREATH